MSSFRKGDRCVTDDATFVAGRIAEDAPVYQVRRETGAACAGSESPRSTLPPSAGRYERNPRLFVPNWPMYGKTVGRSFAVGVGGNGNCEACGASRPRSDAVALFGNPASPRQAGRRPDGLAVSNRVSPRRVDAARARSKSSLTGGHEHQRRALEWADLYPPTYEASPKRWAERAKTDRKSTRLNS